LLKQLKGAKKWFVKKMAFSFIHFVLWTETSWFMNAFVVINYLMSCFGSVKFVEKAHTVLMMEIVRKENHNQSYISTVLMDGPFNQCLESKQKSMPILLKTKQNVKSPVLFDLFALQLNNTPTLQKKIKDGLHLS
jgi:hypothetical protein